MVEYVFSALTIHPLNAWLKEDILYARLHIISIMIKSCKRSAYGSVRHACQVSLSKRETPSVCNSSSTYIFFREKK